MYLFGSVQKILGTGSGLEFEKPKKTYLNFVLGQEDVFPRSQCSVAMVVLIRRHFPRRFHHRQ